MLLEFLNKLALRLFAFRKTFLVLAAIGLVSGLYAAVTDNDLESWQMRLSLIFSLWALLLFSYAQLFRKIPPPVLPNLRLMERLRDRFRLVCAQVLAIFVVIVTLVMLQMSLKLLTV